LREAFGNADEERIALLKRFGLFAWDSSLEVLEKHTGLLKELGVEELIFNVLAELQQKYPVSKPLEVEIFLMDETNSFGRETLRGVSAFAQEGKNCFILFPEPNVLQVLLAALVHEYHHHWRMAELELYDDPNPLLDRVILEGLAEHFVAHELGVEHCGPWIHAISEAEAHELWPVYREQQNLRMGAAPYLFGSKEKGIPVWAGYAMGYHLVQWYRERHPEATMEELTLLPCEAYLPLPTA
jgi:uncharacterized protein YjaZ